MPGAALAEGSGLGASVGAWVVGAVDIEADTVGTVDGEAPGAQPLTSAAAMSAVSTERRWKMEGPGIRLLDAAPGSLLPRKTGGPSPTAPRCVASPPNRGRGRLTRYVEGYAARRRRISALIAGTTAARSPMTA
jgi:hypothetical protein